MYNSTSTNFSGGGQRPGRQQGPAGKIAPDLLLLPSADAIARPFFFKAGLRRAAPPLVRGPRGNTDCCPCPPSTAALGLPRACLSACRLARWHDGAREDEDGGRPGADSQPPQGKQRAGRRPAAAAAGVPVGGASTHACCDWPADGRRWRSAGAADGRRWTPGPAAGCVGRLAAVRRCGASVLPVRGPEWPGGGARLDRRPVGWHPGTAGAGATGRALWWCRPWHAAAAAGGVAVAAAGA